MSRASHRPGRLRHPPQQVAPCSAQTAAATLAADARWTVTAWPPCPRPGPVAGSGAAAAAKAAQLVSRPAVAALPPVLRGPGRLGQRQLLAADRHRLARPRADRFGQRSRAGAGGRGDSLAAVRALGRGGGRPGGPAQAPHRHPDALLPSGRAAVGTRRRRRRPAWRPWWPSAWPAGSSRSPTRPPARLSSAAWSRPTTWPARSASTGWWSTAPGWSAPPWPACSS